MADIAAVQTNLANTEAAMTRLETRVANLPNPMPTQANIDDLVNRTAALPTRIDAILTAPSTPAPGTTP